MSPTDLMQLALAQARFAIACDEVPIGAVIYHVPTSRILSRPTTAAFSTKTPPPTPKS